MESLLFKYLDELLFRFSTEGFCCSRISITSLSTSAYSIDATAYGDTYDTAKHTPGTEVKAITYSNMQIRMDENTNNNVGSEYNNSTNNRIQSDEAEVELTTTKHKYDIYVIVDI